MAEIFKIGKIHRHNYEPKPRNDGIRESAEAALFGPEYSGWVGAERSQPKTGICWPFRWGRYNVVVSLLGRRKDTDVEIPLVQNGWFRSVSSAVKDGIELVNFKKDEISSIKNKALETTTTAQARPSRP